MRQQDPQPDTLAAAVGRLSEERDHHTLLATLHGVQNGITRAIATNELSQALEAILRRQDAKVLNRLRHHDELPLDAALLSGQEVGREPRELRGAQHRAARIEGSDQEGHHLRQIERVDDAG